MTPETFTQWLAEMRAAGLCATDREAADLLGVTDDTITNYKAKGTRKRHVDLACRALLHRLEPYG